MVLGGIQIEYATYHCAVLLYDAFPRVAAAEMIDDNNFIIFPKISVNWQSAFQPAKERVFY